MKRNIRKIAIIMVIMLFTVIMLPLKSNAGYQAKKGGTSKTNATANDFFIGIRNMEKEGGTLGLNANIDETTYLDNSENGLDCHMAKNTEWGTVAMLSASLYGTAPSGKSNASTTGNDSGVFQMADATREYVAGLWDVTNEYMGKIRGANSRYYDLYTSAVSKPGDAITECNGWKGASGSTLNQVHSMFFRNYSALFGWGCYNGDKSTAYVTDYTSRAVVVCGDKL